MTTKNSILEIADLACLKFDENEQKKFQESFDQALNYFEKLGEVDVKGVDPMVTPHDFSSNLRPDIVKQDVDVETLINLAPDTKDSLYKVPPVV